MWSKTCQKTPWDAKLADPCFAAPTNQRFYSALVKKEKTSPARTGRQEDVRLAGVETDPAYPRPSARAAAINVNAHPTQTPNVNNATLGVLDASRMILPLTTTAQFGTTAGPGTLINSLLKFTAKIKQKII